MKILLQIPCTIVGTKGIIAGNSGNRTWTVEPERLVFIENVQSSWDRTYSLMLVRSADRWCDRRTDGQTDRHNKGSLVLRKLIMR